MKYIYLCDDELVYREQIGSLITKSIEKIDYPLLISAKTKNSQEILKENFDYSASIYFLDVNIVGSPLNGFELGKEIRRRDPKGYIIFITTFEELAFETFKYRLEAMDYIVKDQPKKIANRIQLCLEAIIERESTGEKKENKEEIFSIKFGDELIRLATNDIVFIETSNRSHMVIIYTINETIELADNLKRLEDILPDYFIRTHRSFLVNQAYIKKFDLKQCTLELTTGQFCLVARRMKKKMQNMFSSLS